MRTHTIRRIASVLAVFVSGVLLSAQQRDPKQYQQTLENPDRIAALQVERVVEALAIRPGMRIADLGAGSGIFTLPLARATGPTGRVFAVDIDEGLLAIVTGKARSAQLGNVQAVVAGESDPRLPEPVDLIFVCDTMHHLPDQGDYVRQFAKLLRPGGRVAVIEFSPGHWPAGHEALAITPEQVDGWMKAAGFRRTAAYDFLASNFFHEFQR
jgi:arsenite methyltransferase